MSSQPVFSVSDFVAVLNQTLETAYSSATIVGELANFRVSKNRWVYFDLKDEHSSVRFFGSVYQLPGPLEDGMMLQVVGAPRLHPQYGFSVNIRSLMPVGEGSLKKAEALLEAKLKAEGLFDHSRKRPLVYPPRKVGLITSGESAAYADFMKILSHRWAGVEVSLADVQVQGEVASAQIVRAIEYFNSYADEPEVLVIIRGGGSAEDLSAFSSEQVARAVAASRITTLVAVGHETDTSLAELAADKRASTPSNAAEILTPDKTHELLRIGSLRSRSGRLLSTSIDNHQRELRQKAEALGQITRQLISSKQDYLRRAKQLLGAFSPIRTLERGYVLVYDGKKVVRSTKQLKKDSSVKMKFHDGSALANIEETEVQ